jgi:two-component system response regulator
MFRILLAEDNPGDVVLFREALRGCDLVCEIVVAEDGQKAMSLLEDASRATNEGGADLIVLDVNLPKHSGDEVLRRIRSDASLADVPVIMLTSSAFPADEARAASWGANLYIQKSSDLEGLFEIGRAVEGMLKRKGAANP